MGLTKLALKIAAPAPKIESFFKVFIHRAASG